MLAIHRNIRFAAIKPVVVIALVVLVIATIAGLIIPAIGRVREAAARTATINNLKQIALRTESFHDTFDYFPPAIGTIQGNHGTIHMHLRLFLESRMGAPPDYFTRADLYIGQYCAAGDTSWPAEKIYEGKYGVGNFAANWLALHGGPQKNGKTTRADSFPDGLENTILFAVRYGMCNGTPMLWGYDIFEPKAPFIGYYNKDLFQIQPSQSECNPSVANIWFPAMQVAMADASVRIVSPSISPRIWALALHPADGERLPQGWGD